MTHASLFTGIGGFDLAAEWMGWDNIFQCEIDDYCNRLLQQNFPNTIKHGDIKTTDFAIYRGRIDILSGGFPCQPYSTAGKRLGKEDERHLWPYMLRSIQQIQPTWIVGENVRGLTNWNGGLVFDEVQADLEAAGYEVTPFLLPAAGVNAPHRRERIFFLAYSASFRCERELPRREGVQRGEQACGEAGTGCNEVITNTRCVTSNRGESIESRQGINNREDSGRQEKADVDQRLYQTGIDTNAESLTEREQTDKVDPFTNGGEAWPVTGSGSKQTASDSDCRVRSERVQPPFGSDTAVGHPSTPHARPTGNWEDFPTEPGICGGDARIPHRVDRLKGLGNAVVPQVVLQIFKAIKAYEDLKQ